MVQLRYPVKDAKRIATELEHQYGFTTETLTNPTRRQILDKLSEYRDREFASDGQLLVFFSGHGEFANETSEGFFVPADGKKVDRYQDSYFALSRLKSAVNAIPCDHLLLAIDACYSGALDDRIALKGDGDQPRFGRPGSKDRMTQMEIDRIVQERLRTKTRLYFTSGGLEQTPDRSEFVEKFLIALGSTDVQEPILGFNGLRYFLSKARPRPRTGPFGGNEAGTNDFLFVRKQNLLAPAKYNTRADLIDWRAAQKQDDCTAYRTYLEKYPTGNFLALAREKILKCKAEEKVIAAWERAKKVNTCEAYRDFWEQYMDSIFSEEAETRVRSLGCYVGETLREKRVVIFYLKEEKVLDDIDTRIRRYKKLIDDEDFSHLRVNEISGSILVDRIYFPTSISSLNRADRIILEEVDRFLALPSAQQFGVHIPNSPRGETVKNYLMTKGVDEKRITFFD